MKFLTIRKQKRGNFAVVTPEGLKFSVCETRPGKWRASYGADSVRVRKRFDAQHVEEAARVAHDRILGPTQQCEESVAHEIADVFLAWRSTLTCAEETIATDYWPRATQFVEWAEKRGLNRSDHERFRGVRSRTVPRAQSTVDHGSALRRDGRSGVDEVASRGQSERDHRPLLLPVGSASWQQTGSGPVAVQKRATVCVMLSVMFHVGYERCG